MTCSPFSVFHSVKCKQSQFFLISSFCSLFHCPFESQWAGHFFLHKKCRKRKTDRQKDRQTDKDGRLKRFCFQARAKNVFKESYRVIPKSPTQWCKKGFCLPIIKRSLVNKQEWTNICSSSYCNVNVAISHILFGREKNDPDIWILDEGKFCDTTITYSV